MAKMYKRNVFIVGFVGALGMLSFIIGVWNGVAIKANRKPGIRGHHIEDRVKIHTDEYLSPHINSMGK